MPDIYYPPESKAEPGPVPKDLEHVYNLFQAILVLENEIDEDNQALAITTDPKDRQFWIRRIASCTDAIKVLKEHNLPNPPQG